MRNFILVVAVCLCCAGTTNAQTLGFERVESIGAEIMTSETNIPKLTFRAGTSTVEVQAGRGVDVRALMIAAKIRPNDDPQTIVDKVNAVRQRLYPDKEISLTASVPKTLTVERGVSLWKYYIYWNRRSGFQAYWTLMSAAVTFLGRVSGTWDYWECNRCSSWRYMKRIRSGGSWTRALYGGSYVRGFRYQPRTSGARADIIMYFFY